LVFKGGFLGVCSGGSDWRKIEVMRVDQGSGQGKKLSDMLEYVKFTSIAWTHDHKVCIAVAAVKDLSNCTISPCNNYTVFPYFRLMSDAHSRNMTFTRAVFLAFAMCMRWRPI
jgi:hypothetical protein